MDNFASHHAKHVDRVMAEGNINIQEVISGQPPNCQTANIPVKLRKPRHLGNEPAEDIHEEDMARALLHVQIKEWPVFVTGKSENCE